ncbi:hypothetical protein B9G69_009465 [Bdellovibrio sp. SKB1291214]|uniref:hypothetical protein n=1 Tax=Bdellovibrio sp. SKB1291214 TaxID=1732569 RepID=UPI000B51686E|nr:hypothetical protein [Bdellovibrio sp. SKB1291214]UYL07273.1 hypothetical protein B9G69_009465 [Bdellovibrio sp. SKB1291214]
MRFLTNIKETVLKYYEFIKELDEMTMSRLRGEDEFDRPAKKTEHKRAPRKNNVKVEDLRPQKQENTAS